LSAGTPERPDKPSRGSHRDAKAEARAAKAYAKAQRPWWKKKRFILPLGLVLLIALVSVSASGGGGGTDVGGSGGGSGGGSASKDSGGGDGASGKVGQAITNAGTTYKVTRARTARTIGDPDLGGTRADGTFVIVNLQLTNNKDETKTFSDTSAKIETSDGKTYETSDKTTLAFGDEGLLLKDIQPDLTTRGKLAFELPPSKVSGSTLVIEDLFGDGEIRVDLGL
jgi:hypothetical protein